MHHPRHCAVAVDVEKMLANLVELKNEGTLVADSI
jgi:hypothetical protein